MDIAGEIVAEAETWLGTPFQWQARLKGIACDCKGLIAGVAARCGRPEADSLEALAGDYGQTIDAARLRAGLARLFDRAAAPAAGDIALVRIAGKAQHLAIVTAADPGAIRTIEALSRGPQQVSRYRRRAAEVDSFWRWRSSLLETRHG